MVLVIGIALYEQSKPDPNRYIMIIAIVIFMYGLMRLMAKIPSKNSETEEKENDQ